VAGWLVLCVRCTLTWEGTRGPIAGLVCDACSRTEQSAVRGRVCVCRQLPRVQTSSSYRAAARSTSGRV
jgi:hypothetical protein